MVEVLVDSERDHPALPAACTSTGDETCAKIRRGRTPFCVLPSCVVFTTASREVGLDIGAACDDVAEHRVDIPQREGWKALRNLLCRSPSIEERHDRFERDARIGDTDDAMLILAER